ncbi:MAG: hypothetical protein ACLQU2_29820, partial [Candidatus Binataceae bacterium]
FARRAMKCSATDPLSIMRQFANSTSTNLRHAAALALVGWYLMMPPFHKDSEGMIDGLMSHAPVSQWDHVKSFDTAQACETGWKQNIDHRMSSLRQFNLADSRLGDLWKAATHEARCISSDDPRLVK